MRSCSSPSRSQLFSDMRRQVDLPGQRKRRAGCWWHLSRSGCHLPRPLGDYGSICSRGGAAFGHGHDHAQVLRRSSQFVGGGNTESWLWPRRIALRDLRALLSGAITLLGCIVLISGSGKAALDLGGPSPSLGLAEGLRPAMLSAGGVLAIVAVLLRHLAEGRLVAFVSMLVVAVGLHCSVGVAPALGLAPPSVMLCCQGKDGP